MFGVVSQTGAVVGDLDAEALFDRLVTAAIPDQCGRGSPIDLAGLELHVAVDLCVAEPKGGSHGDVGSDHP